MKCQDARPLVPGYLDGELSEAQAAPLRQHLLGCSECRVSAQAGKTLKEWFVDDEPVQVPAGFAARVARRAFAGDRGGATVVAGPGESRAGEGRLLSFVLQLTAVAAALLMALSIGLRAIELPSGGELQADDASKEWAIQELDRLNLTGEEGSEDSADVERESDE